MKQLKIYLLILASLSALYYVGMKVCIVEIEIKLNDPHRIKTIDQRISDPWYGILHFLYKPILNRQNSTLAELARQQTTHKDT